MLSESFEQLNKEKLRTGFSVSLILVFLFLAGAVSANAGTVESISFSQSFKNPAPKAVLGRFRGCLGEIKALYDQIEIKGLTGEIQTKLKMKLSSLVLIDKKVSDIFIKAAQRVSLKKHSSRALKRLTYRSKMAFVKYKNQFQRLINISIKLLKGPVNKLPEFYQPTVAKLRRLKWLEETLPKMSVDLKKLPVKAPAFRPRTSFDTIKKKLKNPRFFLII